MKNLIRKAVIPVAGLGTRGLPFTKEIPKEMLPIIDIPTIQFIVEEVIAAGIEQVIFVTSRGKNALQDYFDLSPALDGFLRKKGKHELADKLQKIGTLCEVLSVRQKEPLGLGHAVLCAQPIVGDEKFVVCLGDEIFPPWDQLNRTKPPVKQLVETALELKTSTVGVMEVPLSETKSYGILKISEDKISDRPARVLGTVEKPEPEKAPSRYAIIGRYVFDPIIFDYLAKTPKGAGGEIQLTDAMTQLCDKEGLHAVNLKGCRYDIGNPLFYVKAQIDEALRRPELAGPLREYLKNL
ncbi:MAG: UTP--glucose-1-phosphate uridylyltransferase [Proteobacteria bacterium]|nr:UTP--glucose-1-phosphate uridylyltransferase [Pseudomonadota bacterium]